MEPETDQTSEVTTPTAETMLARLSEVDVNLFDSKQVMNELKGNKQWISILTIPVTTILLGLLTLIGMLVSGSILWSFVISAGLLFFIGKLFDQYEQQYRHQARQEVIRRVQETEGEFGLIPHFKHFLPNRYRHLWQSLRKGNYVYVDQYIQAVVLLQNQLDAEKFTKIWHLSYPETVPEATTGTHINDYAA